VVVYILDIPTNDKLKSSMLDSFIFDQVKQKLNVLCRLLKTMRIKYKLVTSLDEGAKVVIPTCSITYDDPNSLFKTFSGIIIVDNFYNIYKNEEDKELNFFKLSIYQLSENSDVKISEILDQRYGFLKLIINKIINQ
ncbi:MAG: hypothetical protein ACOX6N_05410, partial [Patescibacteria group bacterium]|jgi:hypothetical protein